MNSLDHFRYIVDLEAGRLVALAPRTGETFIRKALADTIARLNERLRDLGGTPVAQPNAARAVVALESVRHPVASESAAITVSVPSPRAPAARIAEDSSSNDALVQLVVMVAAGLSLSPNFVMTSNREHRYAYARQMSMHLAYNVFGLSSTRIARFFEKRDHTTVLYGRDRIQADLDVGKIDPVVWEDLVQRVRDLGAQRGLIRTTTGRASNDVPELTAVSA